MIKKTALYLSLFLLSLMLFLLASLPAEIVWHKGVVPQLKGNNIQVEVLSLNGTIWDGQALVRYQDIESIVNWDVSILGVLSLELPVALKVNSQVGLVDIRASIGLNSIYVELLSADIELAKLTPLFKRQRVKLDGQLVAKDIQFEVVDNQFKSASGLLSWSGGNITYPAGRQLHERTLPMFKGRLVTKTNGDIFLGVRDVGASFDLIEGLLDIEGSALLTVKRRLLDLSDEAWPQNSREKDTVFKVKKNIYN
ncbi:MAG: hypothetical protein ACI84K_000296 [Pseudohongiellaceae bacterium]